MKPKIAFIKFGGMAFGGTEKVLQTIASELPKNKYEVDYFYCDAAPYIGSDYKHIDTDPTRIEYCLENGVNVIKFNVEFKDITTPTHDWINTDFWDYFDERKYELIVTGRAGHPEYPFTKIKDTKIIDTIHLAGFAENKLNVYKTVLISSEQRKKWIKSGGLKKKSTIIPNPVYTVSTDEKFETNNKFVFGMHQRDDENIFSHIPLEAYKKIESDETLFILLGGNEKYKEQAQNLNIKNIMFLPTTPDIIEIHKFLNSLTVYAHGRKDGEQCSTAIIEAMSHGLPLISHVAPSMGQAEQISNAGVIAESSIHYAEIMKKFMEEEDFYNQCVQNSKDRFNSIYSLDAVMKQYINLFNEAIEFKDYSKYELFLHYIQNIKNTIFFYSSNFLKLIVKITKKIIHLFR